MFDQMDKTIHLQIFCCLETKLYLLSTRKKKFGSEILLTTIKCCICLNYFVGIKRKLERKHDNFFCKKINSDQP